ncbi:AAA family ATPase [Tuanshanicoccus lijuaniae]|uniref:AAA family ATPase n=1 Tax=Aerococcaceae bacterium zg-1292 TaxID=2774330 RepID=UPI0019361A8F|nr:AAA family ATPase [Aerococcaceae bacterium zg-1292]QQA38024.1 AAA family ATPase [Aerococcaceae bacterium zg-1292]
MFKGDISTLPSSTILEKRIISSSDSPFARFMKAIQATDWVRQGHDTFHTEGQCPYCQQTLPEDFESNIAQCFDEEYEADLEKLRIYKSTYGNAVNSLWQTYNNNLSNAYHKIEDDLKAYSKIFETFKAKAEINAQRFKDKLSHPDTIVSLEDLTVLGNELNDMIDAMNIIIQENNEVVNDRTKKQPQCKADVIRYLAFLLESEIKQYKESRSKLQKDIDILSCELNQEKERVKNLRKKISELRKQVVNTSAAVEGINALLNDTGFQGFYLREKEDTPNVYEVIRSTTGKVAENLSEGERNFIAFLYFHQLVLGSLEADSVVKDKIVVIDDPVSSMDSSTLFVVGALVRDMIAFVIQIMSQKNIQKTILNNCSY